MDNQFQNECVSFKWREWSDTDSEQGERKTFKTVSYIIYFVMKKFFIYKMYSSAKVQDNSAILYTRIKMIFICSVHCTTRNNVTCNKIMYMVIIIWMDIALLFISEMLQWWLIWVHDNNCKNKT
jgi:hypothetical protein